VVGTGAHDLRDGGIDIAAFARPSGVAAGVQALYVADADASAIRSVRLLDAHVRTLAGAGLYESGDTDGVPNRVRLQGPTAIALDPGGSILWIADTLNGKIKALSLRGGGVRTLAVPYRLHEPGGIASAAQSLWVANTNAHEVLRIDTGTGQIRRVPIGD
jgi:streptogramin lyase